MTKTISSRFTVTVAAVFFAFLLTACSGTAVAKLPEPAANPTGSVETLEVLSTADPIMLDKAAISFGDSWTVKVDDETVGEIKGQVIPVFGDTYSMFSNDGDLVGSEAEEVARILPGATTYDYNNVVRGGIDQNLSAFLQSYKVKNAEDELVGTAEQNFSLTLDFDIKNADGVVEYHVSKAFISIGASLTLEREVENPDVDVQDAIWLAVMINEINEASDDENSK